MQGEHSRWALRRGAPDEVDERASGVLRRQSIRSSDAVESLSLPELLVEYWVSLGHPPERDLQETTGKEMLLIMSLSMMLLASVESWSRRGMRLARPARPLSNEQVILVEPVQPVCSEHLAVFTEHFDARIVR